MCIEDELANLGPIELLNAGKNVKEIAEITGLTTKHVILLLKEALVEKTKNHLIQGKKVSEIAYILDVRESTVKLWIKTYDLRRYWISRLDIDGTKADKPAIYRSFLQLKGLVEISKQFHFFHEKIKGILEEQGFKVFQGSTLNKAISTLNGESFRPLNSELREMIDGMMLGDLHIEVMLRTVAPQLTDVPSFKELEKAIEDLRGLQSTSDQDWRRLASIYNKAMMVIEEMPTARFNLAKAILEEKWVKKASEKLIENNYPTHIITKSDKITLTAKSTFQMYEQHQRWYPNGKKIIPIDLNMTSNIALFWFIDDGFLSKYQVGFSTDCFSKNDINIISQELFDKVQINTHLYEHKDSRYPDKTYYALYISKKENIDKFFAYLEKADKKLLETAKREFPWKFNRDLKKKDVIK